MSTTAVPAEVITLVRQFNALRRTPSAPSGYCANKWLFGLHLVPLPPPGNLLFLVNPGSRYVHCEGPLPADQQPLNPTQLNERAHEVAVLLLKAFVSGLGAPEVPARSRLGPWELACEDPRLGAAVSRVLRSLGVRSEVCGILDATEEEKRIAQEEFQSFMMTLVQTAGGRP